MLFRDGESSQVLHKPQSFNQGSKKTTKTDEYVPKKRHKPDSIWECTYSREMNHWEKITHEYVVSECVKYTNTVSNLLSDTCKHLTEFYTPLQTLRMDG